MTQTKTNKADGFHYAYAIVAACIAMTCLPCALVLSCAGIGGVIFNPVGTALINSGAEGWRTAYLVFGVIVLVGTLPFTLLVVRNKPEDKGLLPYGANEAGSASDEKGGEAAAPATAGMSAPEAMRTPAFFALAAFCGVITLNQTIYQFLPSYAQSFSDTLPAVAAASGVVASAAMAGQAVGKVLLGAINDKSVHLGVFLGIGAGAVGVTVMWLVPGVLPLLLAGAFLFGVVYAMTTVQTPLLVRTVFGSADYANIYSRVSMVGSLMGTVAAVFWGFVCDSAGGYPLMFILGYACMAVCLVLALFSLRWKARQEA